MGSKVEWVGNNKSSTTKVEGRSTHEKATGSKREFGKDNKHTRQLVAHEGDSSAGGILEE